MNFLSLGLQGSGYDCGDDHEGRLAKKRRLEEAPQTLLTRAAIASLYGPEQRCMPTLSAGSEKIESTHPSLTFRVFRNNHLFRLIQNFLVSPSISETLIDLCVGVWKKSYPQKSDFSTLCKNAEKSVADKDKPYQQFVSWLTAPIRLPAYRDLCSLSATCGECYTQFHTAVNRMKIGEAIVKSKCAAFCENTDSSSTTYVFNQADSNSDFEALQLILGHASKDLSHALLSNTKVTYATVVSHCNPPTLRSIAMMEEELCSKSRMQRSQITDLFFYHIRDLDFPLDAFFDVNDNSSQYPGYTATKILIERLGKEQSPQAHKTLFDCLLHYEKSDAWSSFLSDVLTQGSLQDLQKLQQISPSAFSSFISAVDVPTVKQEQTNDWAEAEACYKFLTVHMHDA